MSMRKTAPASLHSFVWSTFMDIAVGMVYPEARVLLGWLPGADLLECAPLVCLQVATELVVGFPTTFLTQEVLDRQKSLFATWLAGFVALPVNLPGFGEEHIDFLTCQSLVASSTCCIP